MTIFNFWSSRFRLPGVHTVYAVLGIEPEAASYTLGRNISYQAMSQPHGRRTAFMGYSNSGCSCLFVAFSAGIFVFLVLSREELGSAADKEERRCIEGLRGQHSSR